MLEKFRDRLHKNKADVGANTVSSSAREKFAHQDANTFKNSDNSDTFDEDEIGLENERRLSKQQHSHDQDDDSRLEEPHNQEVIHTTYKSPDLKLPFRNPPRLGNGRLSSDSQLKISEDHLTVDPPRSTPSQLDRQRIFKDSQSHSQLQERMNVVNDPPLDFAPGEDPTLQEPDRELALSGINQNDLIPTTRSSIFGDHFPSTPSLSEIISSAKDKFRKTFEESTRTLDSSSRPVVGSANQRTTPGLDRILGDSTSTSGISSSNIQSPDEVRTFQQGQVLGDSNNGPVNQGLGSIDGASVRHTIQEIGQNTGRVIQETTNILGDTIRNGKQGIEKIFRGVNDLASRSNGEGLGNPDPATLRYKLPTSGITDTLGQSFNRNSIGDLDGARKAISDTSPTKSARDNIGFPRVNLNRFGQLNLDTANQDDLSGIGLTPHVTAQPIGKFNLNKFDDTGLSSPVTLQAHGRQSSEGSSGFTGLTLPAVNRIDSLGNLKPITVSEIDVKDPTNVDSLHPLGDPQSELIVEPPGLDTSDSSEEGLKVDQTGLPKQQTDSAVKQKQPVVTEGLPHIGNFDVHTPFSIPRNMMTKPTANPISNFEAAKNALLKLQQLTGRLRKKDGTGKKSSATSEEQPSVTDVVKVLQEISKEVISTAENVSKSKAKNVQSTEPNIVGSQILENSWENLQPFLPRDSHPLTIAKPPFPHKHHLVGIFPSTTLKTPLDTSSITPAFQKLLDRTSTYYTTPSAPKADTNIQMAVKPINNQFGNNEPSSTLSSALINKKIKEHQTNHLEPVQSSVTASNGLVSLPSGFANDDTIGMVQSNHQANRPIPFGLNRELPQSINDMLTPKPEAVILPPKASITPSQGSGAIDTAQLPSIGAGEPVQLPSISGDLSSSTMSSSSSDRVESRQPATKNIEDESSPVLAARHQNDIAISADTPRDIYFVGTGMKLPLQMVKKEGGEVHLSVDIDKLCSCKNNSSCAKNQSADGSELKKDLVLDGSSSSSVEKSAGDGFAKRNVPTHRSLRDVEDRYAVEWEVGDPEEVSSDVRHSADTEDTRGEHRIEIEIDDPVIIPLNSSSHTEEASNVRIVNRLSANTDEDIKTTVGSPHMTTSSNESNSNSDPDRNTIKKISDKVLSNHAVDVVMELPKATQDKKNATANIYKSEDLPKKKASPYDNTVQTNLTKLHVKKAENYQYRSPFRRLHYPELGSKKSLDSTESVPSSTEKSTYLSNLLKKLRSRLPTQEPRTVNTNLRSMSNLFSHRTRNQQVESDEGHKPTKLSNRFKDLNVDRYSNLALRNRLFPTLGRQKEPLAKLEKSADHEKEVLPVEDQDKEDQSGGIVKNVLAWFKNLNNKQKR
ncbi:unnamed protein product [Callosobruchus maculatus]|nr:unnamed protein product [Callosobruchus maculatus]